MFQLICGKVPMHTTHTTLYQVPSAELEDAPFGNWTFFMANLMMTIGTNFIKRKGISHCCCRLGLLELLKWQELARIPRTPRVINKVVQRVVSEQETTREIKGWTCINNLLIELPAFFETRVDSECTTLYLKGELFVSNVVAALVEFTT